jgi:hypothetical protein
MQEENTEGTDLLGALSLYSRPIEKECYCAIELDLGKKGRTKQRRGDRVSFPTLSNTETQIQSEKNGNMLKGYSMCHSPLCRKHCSTRT